MRSFFYALTMVILLPLYAGAIEYTLDDLYRIALERAEKVKISAEDLYVAERTKDKALSVLVPKFTGQAGYTLYKENQFSDTGSTIQPDETTHWTVKVEQSMSMSGREITAFRIAKDGIEKSKYDLHAVKETYMLNVAGAYYALLRSRKMNDIAKTNAERLKKYRDVAALRLKVGEVTKTAVLRAEAELSGAEADRVRAQNNEIFGKVYLARTVGIEGDFEVRDEAAEPGIAKAALLWGCEPLTPECLKKAASETRADVKSLAIQKRMAEDQVKFTRGAYWPTLSAEATYWKQNETPPTGGLVPEKVYAGFRITFPFFEGGLRVAEVREADAKRRQAEYALRDLEKTVGVEVENAFLDYTTQKMVLKTLEDQLAYAKDNYKAVSKQFEFGLASSLDVLDANTLLVTAERQLTDSIFGYQLAILRLQRVTGTLLTSAMGKK
jgi:outer membrane protein